MKTNIQKHIYILFFTSLIAIILLGSISTAFIISIGLGVLFHKVLKPTKQNKVYSQFLSIIFGIIILVTPFISAIQSDTKMHEEQAKIVSGQSETYNYITDEGTMERSIELKTLSVLGDDQKIEHLSIIGDQIYLDYESKENLTSELTRSGILINTKDILESITPIIPEEVHTINLTTVLPLVDQYGNTSIESVSIITFKRTEWEKVNWGNFLTNNIETIADSFWIHPALN